MDNGTNESRIQNCEESKKTIEILTTSMIKTEQKLEELEKRFNKVMDMLIQAHEDRKKTKKYINKLKNKLKETEDLNRPKYYTRCSQNKRGY